MTTAGAAAAVACARLAAAGVAAPRLDARLLVAHVLGVAPQTVFTRPETPLSAAQAATLDSLVTRRAAREPVSRIVNRRGFWTLDLALGPDTLDPRPDSETLVEALLAALPGRDRRLRVVDFGTGSGCLLLALLTERPAAWGLGVDRSPGALAVALANAAACGLAGRTAFVCADWGRGLDGCFDAILANPPYIPSDEIAGLEPEVAVFDPRLALAGGPDGLDCYRVLVPHVARLLTSGGAAALEVGAGQAEAVGQMAQDAGLTVAEIRRDLGGVPRCVVAIRPA